MVIWRFPKSWVYHGVPLNPRSWKIFHDKLWNPPYQWPMFILDPPKLEMKSSAFRGTQKKSSATGIFMGFSPKLRLYETVSHPQALVRAFFSSIYWVVLWRKVSEGTLIRQNSKFITPKRQSTLVYSFHGLYGNGSWHPGTSGEPQNIKIANRFMDVHLTKNGW